MTFRLKKQRVSLGLAIGVLSGAALFLLFLITQKFQEGPKTPLDQDLSEKTQELPSEIFEVSTGKETFPRYTQVEFHPYVVREGREQRIVVGVKDPAGLKEVSALISTDKGEEGIIFHKLRDQEDISFWQGSWQVHDTAKETHYVIEFRALSNQGQEDKMTAFFRGQPYEQE